MTESEVINFKAEKIGEIEKKVLFCPKNDGEGFKCPINASIYLIDRNKLMNNSTYNKRNFERRGYNLLLIDINDKYYFAQFIVRDVSKDNYIEMLKKFTIDFYSEYN